MALAALGLGFFMSNVLGLLERIEPVVGLKDFVPGHLAEAIKGYPAPMD